MVLWIALIAAANVAYIVWTHNLVKYKLAADNAPLKKKICRLAWPLAAFNALQVAWIIATIASFFGGH